MNNQEIQNKVIITQMDVKDCLPSNRFPETEMPRLLLSHFENGRMKTLRRVFHECSLVGSIYVARVDSLAPKIHAVFVKIDKDTICYLPEEEIKDAIFTHKPSKKAIAIGDELLVQILRLPLKTKLTCVTTRLSLTGHYAVVGLRINPGLGISKKIPKHRQQELIEELKNAFPESAGFDLVLRTNCNDADFFAVKEEIEVLQTTLEALLQTAASKIHFSCLYQPKPDYISYIKGCYPGEIGEIVTDIKEIYQTLTDCRQLFSKDIHLRFYEDEYPLYNLYSLKKELTHALQEKVWLKSGAYLLIEPTEALTVIDVNSGKKETGKKEEYFYNINLEAAEEISHQLALRNISGICIIDFIDLPTEKERKSLLCFMRSLCKKDHIKTQVVDFTKLQLMEITRKKTGPSLLEQILQD